MTTKTWTRWTETENAVFQRLFDSLPDTKQPPSGYSDLLAPELPGRSQQDIRNGWNMYRRRRLHICSKCRAPRDGDKTLCSNCRQAVNDLREERLAQGLCACGQTLSTPGSSTTQCPTCRTRRQSYAPKALQRFKNQQRTQNTTAPALQSHRPVKWPACGHCKWAAQLVAKTGRPVIDLFGGTGELLRLVTVFGGTAFGYYDLDPRIHNLVAHARCPKATPLSPEALQLLKQADYKLRKDQPRRLQVLGQALQALKHCECRDALDVLAKAHLEQPKDAIFVCDPPWPGCSEEHPSSARIDHKSLMNALFDLPQGQDFILSLGAEREALKLVAQALPVPKGLYWRRSGPFGVKGFVLLSPGLDHQAATPDLTPITSFQRYGL